MTKKDSKDSRTHLAPQEPKDSWSTPSNRIALGALILSFVAIFVSFRSCSIADKSLEISKAEFNSQRALVLGGTTTADETAIELKPSDSSISLLEAHARFPDKFGKGEWQISPPDHLLHVLMLRTSLQQILEQKVRPTRGNVAVSNNGNVPLVITSQYTAKGESFEDKSLYRIPFSFVLGKKVTPAKITFNGLIFMSHLPQESNPAETVNSIWSEDIGQRPPK